MKRLLYILPLIALLLASVYWHSQSAKADIFGSALVGWWTLDTNQIVNNVIDTSASGNNGIMVAAATTTQEVPAILSTGLLFNGSTQYVNIGDPASGALDFASTTDFSVSLWLKSSATNSFALAKTTGTNAAGYDFIIGNAGVAGNNAFRISDGSHGTVASAVTSGMNNGKWHHYVGVVDRTAIRIIFYVDGKHFGADSNIAIIGPVATAASLQIGARSGGAFLNGSVDDVRIFSKALSAAEVKTLYYQGISQHGYGGI